VKEMENTFTPRTKREQAQVKNQNKLICFCATKGLSKKKKKKNSKSLILLRSSGMLEKNAAHVKPSSYQTS
jgi:hypothetical protein